MLWYDMFAEAAASLAAPPLNGGGRCYLNMCVYIYIEIERERERKRERERDRERDIILKHMYIYI